MRRIGAFALVCCLAAPAAAQDCPKPCEGKCLTQEQVDKLRAGVEELKDIHGSPAVVTVQTPVVVVRDTDGRIYVNGGATAPLQAKVRIGQHVDRDVRIVLDARVWYRPEPASPMFRLRVKAQAGVLIPELVQKARSQDSAYPLDAGLAWDFFHLSIFNMSAYTGVRSAGIGPGLDITKNFGVYAGYALLYDGFKSSVMTAAYFSFN